MNHFNDRIQTLLELSNNIQDETKRLQIQHTLKELDQVIQHGVVLKKVLVQLEVELPTLEKVLVRLETELSKILT